MIHILLHIIVPFAVAAIFYSSQKWRVFLILILTMLVDLDHLFADPVYDPNRCSILFHPLHTLPAIAMYVMMFLFPYLPASVMKSSGIEKAAGLIHLIGLGLVIHMALDAIDCFV